MRISYEWLKTMVDVPQDPQALVDEFTRTGTEVEAVERVGADLDHVVTAQVLKKEPHPDSDHMWVCTVDVGDKNLGADGTPSRCRSSAAPRTSRRATTSCAPSWGPCFPVASR